MKYVILSFAICAASLITVGCASQPQTPRPSPTYTPRPVDDCRDPDRGQRPGQHRPQMPSDC